MSQVTIPKIAELIEMVSRHAIDAEIERVSLKPVEHQGTEGWKLEIAVKTATDHNHQAKTIFFTKGQPLAEVALQLSKLVLELHHIR